MPSSSSACTVSPVGGGDRPDRLDDDLMGLKGAGSPDWSKENDPVPTSIPPSSTPPNSTPRSPDPEETDERPRPAAVAIHRELAARGPLTLIALRAALAGQSVAGQSITVTEDDLDDLVDGEIPLVAEIAITGPPAYIALDRVLLGRVFTHRLTAEEIQSDLS